ncbi:hypothetical protein ACFU6N_25290, partial [Streptomyces sp. NPDC057496]
RRRRCGDDPIGFLKALEEAGVSVKALWPAPAQARSKRSAERSSKLGMNRPGFGRDLTQHTDGRGLRLFCACTRSTFRLGWGCCQGDCQVVAISRMCRSRRYDDGGQLTVQADSIDEIDWTVSVNWTVTVDRAVSVDSVISRAHQYATHRGRTSPAGLTRTTRHHNTALHTTTPAGHNLLGTTA